MTPRRRRTAYKVQDQFIRQLLESVSSSGCQRLSGSSAALQQVFGKFGKSRSRGGARHVLRFIREQVLETPHVGHADRMLEEGEHRRVVRRVACEDDVFPGRGKI